MDISIFSKIGVVGLGYVGLPLAVEFAKKGIEVVGISLKNSNKGKNMLFLHYAFGLL